MACEQEEIYSIVQGSDTDFNGNHFLFDYFVTNIDLSDHTAKCDVPSAFFSKDLSIQYDLEEQLFYVIVDFTAEETLKMPVGSTEIIVVVYNSQGKQQSLKKIPIKVLKKGNVLPETTGRVDQPLVATPGYAISQIIKTPAYDHDTLRHRDYPDQHPISAITDLQTTIENINTNVDSKVAKTTFINKVYGTDENVDQTLYNKDSFGQVDDVKVGGTSVVINKVANLGTMANEAATSYTKTIELAAVALDNNYNSLDNKPTIGDATLTFQKNGTIVDTFTANATSNKTINFTVPTSASDVNALPDSTKYAAAVDMSLNETTYVLTLQLKDQNGNNIGQAKTVDLPIESVVVSGSYDSDTKEVVLTLQGGSEVRFSVADLVAGLQTEISATNMVSSDFIDDTEKAHKFVSSQEKATWNGKQDAITSNNKCFSH